MALQRLSGNGREEGYMPIFSVLKVKSQQNFFLWSSDDKLPYAWKGKKMDGCSIS